MKAEKSNLQPEQEHFDQMVLVPMKLLTKISEAQDRVLEILQSQGYSDRIPGQPTIKKYVSEAEAKQLIGKGTTWFWQMRTSGTLRFRKVGNKVFYKLEDIERLFNNDEEEGL